MIRVYDFCVKCYNTIESCMCRCEEEIEHDNLVEKLEKSEAEVERLKKIMKDISTKMDCHCDDMDYDCQPCDRCILKYESEAKS